VLARSSPLPSPPPPPQAHSNVVEMTMLRDLGRLQVRMVFIIMIVSTKVHTEIQVR
jgi:hypothetical protein